MRFYRSADDQTIVVVPGGTVIEAEHIPGLDPPSRDAFERRITKEYRNGFPHGELIVFIHDGSPRSAYYPADLESLSWV